MSIVDDVDDVATVADDVATVVPRAVDVAVDVATVVEGREKGGFVIGVGSAPRRGGRRSGMAGRHEAGEGVGAGRRGAGMGGAAAWRGDTEQGRE